VLGGIVDLRQQIFSAVVGYKRVLVWVEWS